MTGNLNAAYLAGFGFGEVLARVDGGSTEAFALRDRLGTTVGWLDDRGGVAALTVRDASGVRGATASVVPFGYTGHAEDPTGWVWGRARYLEGRRGSWLADDSVFDEPRVLYAHGGPSWGTDPTGRTLIEYYLLNSKGEHVFLAGEVATFGSVEAAAAFAVKLPGVAWYVMPIFYNLPIRPVG